MSYSQFSGNKSTPICFAPKGFSEIDVKAI